jgi:hypothetical protein
MIKRAQSFHVIMEEVSFRAEGLALVAAGSATVACVYENDLDLGHKFQHFLQALWNKIFSLYSNSLYSLLRKIFFKIFKVIRVVSKQFTQYSRVYRKCRHGTYHHILDILQCT